MKKRLLSDIRSKFWTQIEEDIQTRGKKKDKNFVLKGKWKKLIRKDKRFKTYLVDGDWVRTNLSIIFGHGGHGLVHEFIPHDEIWVDECHQVNCLCKNVRKDRKMSDKCIESTILHEIAEYKLMKKGMIYWDAHQIALDAEREAGILKDIYTEEY